MAADDNIPPREPSAKVDIARIALRRAKEDVWRRHPQPRSAAPPTPRRGRTAPEPITLRAALDELIAQRMGWLSTTAAAVIAVWPSIVGEEVARHVTAVDVDPDAGALVLRPDSSAWATQVRLLAPMLIPRLNIEIGGETLTTIRLLPPPRLKPSAKAAPVARAPQPTPQWAPRSKTRLYSRPPRAPLPADPAVLAAAERQAQQTTREPEHLVPGPRSRPVPRVDRKRTRALLRARAQRQPSE
ncbi:DciA family protein [Streptomyces hygroscopicus]|uniref:DciA family protein n=1 Tax=Streptomyces hygroscopicus TaxID=1912 RepID=UPI00367DA1F9